MGEAHACGQHHHRLRVSGRRHVVSRRGRHLRYGDDRRRRPWRFEPRDRHSGNGVIRERVDHCRDHQHSASSGVHESGVRHVGSGPRDNHAQRHGVRFRRHCEGRFLRGSALVGTDASAPYSVSWTGGTAGTYALTAVATDKLGATTTSAAVSVTITAASPPPSTLPDGWSHGTSALLARRDRRSRRTACSQSPARALTSGAPATRCSMHTRRSQGMARSSRGSHPFRMLRTGRRPESMIRKSRPPRPHRHSCSYRRERASRSSGGCPTARQASALRGRSRPRRDG